MSHERHPGGGRQSQEPAAGTGHRDARAKGPATGTREGTGHRDPRRDRPRDARAKGPATGTRTREREPAGPPAYFTHPTFV